MDYLGKVLEVGEHCNLGKKMRKLKRKLDDLRSREFDVISELEYAESLSLKRRKKEVDNWLENVKQRKYEAEIAERALCKERRLHERLRMGKHLDELTGEMAELLERGRFHGGLVLDGSEARGNVLLAASMVGQRFKEHLDTIIQRLLMKEEASIVGIYGMGGVGKTTLVAHVHNRLLQDFTTFGYVYWVTVSRDFSVRKLQSDIARAISLDLEDEDDEKKRASILVRALTRRNKCVLILDDVWDSFSLERVGIPAEVEGYRLVLTSRSLDVCRRLGCQANIKVEPLSSEEGWELFSERLGWRGDFPSELEQTARSVARECAGLPLGIITMAGSMRGSEDASEWRDALEKLRESRSEHDEAMETDVYQVLRASFKAINDVVVRQCFLYCALYPEDYKIKRDELIQRFVDEGFIGGMRTRRAEFDRGNTILNKLENVCLLESAFDSFPSEERCVKMHDLVRDLALKITSLDSVFMVRAGERLKDLPEGELWTENVVKASLMRNKISKIPYGFSPNCPRLSTLMLQHSGLKAVPNSFFAKMRGVKVLDLSNTGIKTLPSSVSELKMLSALSLRQCRELQRLPSLAKLTALRRLDLRDSGVKEVPQGMEMLTNLRYLDLHTPKLKALPVGMLSKLSRLQYLVIFGLSKTLKVKGREIASLRNLETFSGQFYGTRGLNVYAKSFEEGGPENYQLQVGLDDPYFAPIESGNFDKRLILKNCKISKSREGEKCLAIPAGVQFMYFHKCRDVLSLCDIASLDKANDLKSLVINDCQGIEYALRSSSRCTPLNFLESLRLAFLQNLRALFAIQRVEFQGPFSSLKNLRIYNCPSIETLFPRQSLACFTNLEELCVEDCGGMSELIASSNEETGFSATKAFPKLKVLQLWNLTELGSICGKGELVCESLREVAVRYCKKLKSIPISLCLHDNRLSPWPCLQTIKAYLKDWWDSLEWEHPKAKDVLEPFCQFSRYL